MWVNPGEIGGNGIDDDGNGLIDDYYGYNFYNESGWDTIAPGDNVFTNHGTHV